MYRNVISFAIISESHHHHRHDHTGNDEKSRSAENYHFRLILTAVDYDERLIKYWFVFVHRACLEWKKEQGKIDIFSTVFGLNFNGDKLMTKRCNSQSASLDNGELQLRPRHFLKLAVVIGFMIAVALIALYYRNFLIILIIVAVWIS